MARSYKRRLPATGRWIFVSNTGIWSADRFLEDGNTDLYYAVSHHHSQDMIAGDRGFLRLDDDKRRVEQRAGQPKVRAGVYAQVEVTGSPRFMVDPDARYYVQPAAQSAERWRVPLRVIGNYLQSPLLVGDLPDDQSFQHLRRPLPTATIPISSEAFDRVVKLAAASSKRTSTTLNNRKHVETDKESMSSFQDSDGNRPSRPYLYGSKRTWEIVFETVQRFDKPVSHAEVHQRISEGFPDFALTNVRADLSMLSVNCLSRGHYYMNKAPRKSDTGSPYDRLIRIGSGRGVCFLPYDPSIHGTWELADVGNSVLQPRFLGTADRAELDSARDAAALGGLLDPGVDSRNRTIAAIVQRDGQPAFRQELLKAYESRCVISGCAIEALLEAAHIMPYRGAHTNIVTNGLLLRADLHKLFDLHLLCVDPDTRTVRLSEGLVSSEYAAFDGVQLRVPVAPFFAPLSDALRYHYERCGWLYAAADGAPLEEYSPEAKANST